MDGSDLQVSLRRAVILPLVAIALFASMLLYEARALRTTLQWVDHADQLIALDRELLKLNVDMETGLRGYQYTGRETFLQPYHQAANVIDGRFDVLNQLLTDNPRQQAQLATIRTAFEQWRALSKVAIAERASQPAPDPQEVRYGEALKRKALMDRIRAEYDTFNSNEVSLRDERLSKVRDRSLLLSISCVLIALGGGAALGLYLLRQRDLARAYQQAVAAQQAADQMALTLARREKEDSVANYRGQIEAIDRSQLVAELGLDGTLLRLNENYLQALGYTGKELAGKQHRFLLTREESESETYGKFWDALRQGIFQSGEFKRVGKDGREIWIEASYNPIFNSSGTPTKIVKIAADVTGRVKIQSELKLQQAAVRKSEGFLERTGRIAGIGGWEIDLVTRAVHWSTEVFRIHGVDPGSQSGLQPDLDTAMAFFPPLSRQALNTAMTASSHGGNGWDLDLELLRTDGRTVAVRSVGSAEMVNGLPVRLVGILQEITERKRVEDELRRATIAAEAANRAKSDFLANMSHEVRTPVNGIIGMTHLALRAQPVPRQRDYLMKIDTAAHSLLRIMNDILDFSKIEAGKMNLERITFSLDEMLKNVLDIVSHKAEQKSLPVRLTVEPEVPRYLVGDPLRTGQILTNLVNNAIKFTSCGQVAIRLEAGQEAEGAAEIRFSVTDTGIGMDREQLATLFQSFNQADTSFTRKYGGTGLGLAICKQLAELMGGVVAVKSVPGHGSTFCFKATYGIAAAGLPVTPRGAPGTGAGSLEKKRLLVVEDSEMESDSLVAMLMGAGYFARAVTSGEEALLTLAQASQASASFDLVVMDWRLPGIHGMETARRIQALDTLTRTPRTLIISAFERGEVLSGAKSDPALEGFLVKPVSERRLLDTVASIFRMDRTAQAVSTSAATSAATSALTGRRVLLVEDNDINCDLATELLTDLGIVVEIAGDGRSAIDRIEAEPFDLVLMDIQMPVMDGLAATEELRRDARFQKLPIVAMTAHAMTGDRSRSLQAGMNDHVTKPINPAALEEMLVRWMPVRAAGVAGPALVKAPAPDTENLPEDLPPFHLAIALVRANGKPKLLRRMILQFRDQYANVVSELTQHLALGQTQEAFRLAHSLKSVAALLEANELAEAARALENSLREAPGEPLATAVGDTGLIDALQHALAPAMAAAGKLDRRAAPVVNTRFGSSLSDETCSVGNRPSILVVDDDPSTLATLDVLCDDYELLWLSDSKQALTTAIERAPVLILLDVVMPGIDGYEVCRQLKADTRTDGIPIIFLTGSGTVDSEEKGLTLGAADYVTKPIQPSTLRARVNSQIRLKKAQQEILRLTAREHMDEMVDEMKRSAAADRSRQQELKMKDDFLSHVSHEIRTPLTSIHAFVGLIADHLAGETNEQQDEYLQIILANVAHLKSMINDLLEATRMRTGKLTVQPADVSIMEAVQYSIHTLQGAAKEKSIQLSYGVPDDAGSVNADPTRLRQILTILIDNAVKFTPEGGAIAVTVEAYDKDPRFKLFKVEDNGCGISPEKIGNIFENFYQVDRPGQSRESGLGLGLHIARQLVLRQRGDIWAQSAPGKGSQFCFTLPIASMDLSPEAPFELPIAGD